MSQQSDSQGDNVPSWSDRREQVLQNRMQSIRAAWLHFTEDSEPDCYLSPTATLETVQNYLKDAEALINRHNIKGRLQLHKVAGLLAASFLKNTPITARDETEPLRRVFRDNQVFALRHALAICFQGAEEELERFLSVEGFNGWFKRTIDFMKRRPDCAEALVLVFDTLASIYISEKLRRGGD